MMAIAAGMGPRCNKRSISMNSYVKNGGRPAYPLRDDIEKSDISIAYIGPEKSVDIGQTNRQHDVRIQLQNLLQYNL